MSSTQTKNISEDHLSKWLHTMAALLVGASFLALGFWLLPGWLGFQTRVPHFSRTLREVGMSQVSRWPAVIPSVLGFAVALRCIWDFGWTGRGTPAPIVPPKRLVVVGFYRYVRNPMYVGFAVGWIGLWIVFGQANWAVIAVVAVAALGVHLFVTLYEEPTLRGKFGEDYEEYCRNVNRWWPHLRAWNKLSAN